MSAPAFPHRPELVHPTAWIAPGAVVRGDVTLGPESSVWFGVVIRGDTDKIAIGPQTNIQDNSVLHADPGFPCTLGARVTVGHAAIVHGATVEDDCLIGMRAVVMNGAVIGAGSLVGVASVVTEGTVIPPGSLVLGTPAKVLRPVNDADRARMTRAVEGYVQRAKAYAGTA